MHDLDLGCRISIKIAFSRSYLKILVTSPLSVTIYEIFAGEICSRLTLTSRIDQGHINLYANSKRTHDFPFDDNSNVHHTVTIQEIFANQFKYQKFEIRNEDQG